MAVSGAGHGKTPQSLATRAIAGIPPVAENGTKAALTTGMTTDRKIFDFLPRRGIMAEIEYPGIAQLVARLIWVQEAERSNRSTRTSSSQATYRLRRAFLLKSSSFAHSAAPRFQMRPTSLGSHLVKTGDSQ